jgi:hypothetical protein
VTPSSSPDQIPKLKARRNALKKHHGADAEVTQDASRELAAATLEKRIREIVDAAPPLSAEQRLKLAGLLVGGA